MTELTKHYYMPNEFTCREQEIINILASVLEKQGIPPEYYSLNGYKEENVCLSKHDAIWEVYIAERGLQRDKKNYTKLEDAINDMIRRLAESKSDYDEMIRKMEKESPFNATLVIYTNKKWSKNELYKSISKAFFRNNILFFTKKLESKEKLSVTQNKLTKGKALKW